MTMTDPLHVVAKTIWWVTLIRAILAIVLGIATVIAPLTSALVAVIIVAAYVFVDGVITIVHGVRAGRAGYRWGAIVAQGVIAVIAGLAAFIWPAAIGLFTGLVLLWVIIIYTILGGIVGILTAGKSGEGAPSRGWIIAFSVLQLLFGILLAVVVAVQPAATLLSLVWLVGIYLIVTGVVLLVVAFRVRGVAKQLGSPS